MEISDIRRLDAMLARAAGGRLALVGGRGFWQSQGSAQRRTAATNNEIVTYVHRHKIPRRAKNISFVYTNSDKGDIYNANPIYVSAGLLIFGSSQKYPFTFNGLEEAQIFPGGIVQSTPLGLNIPGINDAGYQDIMSYSCVRLATAGDVHGLGPVTYNGNYEGKSALGVNLARANNTITAISKAVNSQWTTLNPHRYSTGDKFYCANCAGGAGWSGCNTAAASPRTVTVVDPNNFTCGLDTSGFTGTYTASSGYIGGSGDTNNSYSYCPTAILGIPASPFVNDSYAFVGDSKPWGYGAANGNNGYLARALDGIKPWMNLAISGSSLSSMVAANSNLLQNALLPYVTDVIIDSDTNDCNGGATSATMLSNMQYVVGLFQDMGLGVSVCTIPPIVTTSTDSFQTAGNQSGFTNASNRHAYNDGLLTQTGGWGLKHVFNPADMVEVNSSNVLTHNGDRWKTDGTSFKYTPEGTHYSEAGCDLAAQAIITQILGF